MSHERDLRDLVGDDLSPEELERLGRVHDLLLRAGPPPELPGELAEPPPAEASVVRLAGRRWKTVIGLAAALTVVAFGVGWLAASARDSESTSFATDFVVPMQGTAAAPSAVASISVGERDTSGNWPMAMTIRGLPTLPEGERYELWLTKNGKLVESCGTFRADGEAIVYLNAPFRLRGKGWAVTRAGDQRLLLRTSEI